MKRLLIDLVLFALLGNVLISCASNRSKPIPQLLDNKTVNKLWTTVVSTNTVTGIQTAVAYNNGLNIRCRNRKTEIFINTNGITASGGVIYIYIDGVPYKMSSREARGYRGIFLRDPSMLVKLIDMQLIDYDKLTTLMLNGKIFGVNVPRYTKSDQSIIVQLEGLNKALVPLRQLCN